MDKQIRVILSPPNTPDKRSLAEEALEKLLVKYDGNKNRMARELGFARNTISFWFSKGYIGRTAARKIAGGGELRLQDLRPDVFSRARSGSTGTPLHGD